jgi:signal peptidase I
MNAIMGQWRTNMAVLYSIATWYVFGKSVFVVSESQGDSMLPTIENGSVLFIDRLTYKFKGVKKNDIVVAAQPIDPKVIICKRVTHTEGEEVYGVRIPEKHVWLQGDNEGASFDSRHHGPVPLHLIEGRVVKIINM